jgi:hypothetical protein
MLNVSTYQQRTKVYLNYDVTEWGVLLLINAYCVHNFVSTKPNKFNAYGNRNRSSSYRRNYYHRPNRTIV